MLSIKKMKNKLRSKKLRWIFASTIVVLGFTFSGLIIVSDELVDRSAKEFLYSNIEDVPEKKVALLLGTGKYSYGGRINLYYQYRINAVRDLYKAGKTEFILISGDNSTVEYNEPETMKADLVKEGIPEEKIFLDYAGFRTWDSMLRMREVFGEDDFIVVSQKFHNERALYIAEVNEIDAIGFNAQDVPVAFSPRVWFRERLARVKVMMDGLLKPDPKFLGEKIAIE